MPFITNQNGKDLEDIVSAAGAGTRERGHSDALLGWAHTCGLSREQFSAGLTTSVWKSVCVLQHICARNTILYDICNSKKEKMEIALRIFKRETEM